MCLNKALGIAILVEGIRREASGVIPCFLSMETKFKAMEMGGGVLKHAFTTIFKFFCNYIYVRVCVFIFYIYMHICNILQIYIYIYIFFLPNSGAHNPKPI